MTKVVRPGSPPLFFLLSAFILISSAQVFADDIFGESTDNFEYTGEKKVWIEQKYTIPVYPENDNLLPLNVVSEQFKYFLDPVSLSVGSDDEVVRYSIVVVSRSGVRNVFYEGIRCDTKEYRTYAYGSGAGPFREMSSGWRQIRSFGSHRYRVNLVRGPFCKGESVPEKIENIIQELKSTR